MLSMHDGRHAGMPWTLVQPGLESKSLRRTGGELGGRLGAGLSLPAWYIFRLAHGGHRRAHSTLRCTHGCHRGARKPRYLAATPSETVRELSCTANAARTPPLKRNQFIDQLHLTTSARPPEDRRRGRDSSRIEHLHFDESRYQTWKVSRYEAILLAGKGEQGQPSWTEQGASSTRRPPRPPPGCRWQPPRNPSRARQDPHGPRRIHLPPYPHRRTSARTRAWST
jgi:hypothetical protein